MKVKIARDLAKGLVVDLDGAVAGLETEDRHTSAASAMIVGARLFAGLCVNFARIADALEDIADQMEDQSNAKDSSS